MTRTIPATPHDFPLETGSAALLIIDMQNDFCHPTGYCGGTLGLDITPMQAIIPRIARLRDWARRNGVPVIYTRESHRPDLSDLSDSKKLRYENAGYPVGSPGELGRYLIQGEMGTAILDELSPGDGELTLDKPEQSAFVRAPLEGVLRERGIRHLLITGVTTQCCVLATYRSASDLGFFALLVEDCCAAFDPRDHEAAVQVISGEGGAIGWVGNSEDIMA